jgi:hypothetical protein
MTKRRHFIKCGLTFSTLPITSLSSFMMTNTAVAAPEWAKIRLESFVADLRYAESVATAQTFKNQGVPVAEIIGDMTELWIQQYSRQWKQKPMSLAGVTGKDALFVLETLAMDYGMRVIFKSEIPQVKTLTGSDNMELFYWIIDSKEIAPEIA